MITVYCIATVRAEKSLGYPIKNQKTLYLHYIKLCGDKNLKTVFFSQVPRSPRSDPVSEILKKFAFFVEIKDVYTCLRIIEEEKYSQLIIKLNIRVNLLRMHMPARLFSIDRSISPA